MFLDLLNCGKLDNAGVDCSNTTDLVKLLDTVVIKLEGGTDADLAILDQEEITGKFKVTYLNSCNDININSLHSKPFSLEQTSDLRCFMAAQLD